MKNKMFTCTIKDSQLEWAVDLPGCSHAGQPFERYDGKTCRKIHFSAKNRTEAARDLKRCLLSSVRDLSD